MQGKKILFICSNKNPNTKYTTRFEYFIREFKKNNEVQVIDLTKTLFFYKTSKLINLIIWKILVTVLIFPDLDVLLLNRYKKEIDKYFKFNSFDFVIIGIVPYALLKLSKYIKDRYKCQVIIDMGDPITANLSYQSYSKFRQKYLAKFESHYLKYVDKLITLNPEISNYYRTLYPYFNKVFTIEQGLDKKEYTPQSASINQNQIINLLYAGFLYKKHREPFEIYQAILQLSNIKKLKLSIYGAFKNIFIPPQGDSFYYGGSVNREILEIEYLKNDIIVFIDNKDTLQVPGKTFEILSLNKPILFIYYNDDSPTLNYFKKYDGIEYTKNNKDDIIIAIQKLINTSYYINRDVSEYYWDNLAIKFASILVS
jgi:hypothetical protein